jgi:hypothetical protein
MASRPCYLARRREECYGQTMREQQASLMAVVWAFLLAQLVLGLATFVPHHAESVKQMRRFTHTPRGAAILLGGTFFLAWVLNFVFVELWSPREGRRRNKDTR